MKNQYFGDVGDYGKYGLLRFLAEHGISVSVNWYLTRDDRSSDGKFVSYLSDKRFRRFSPVIYDELQKHVVQEGRRDILVMNETDLIPDAKYYTIPLPALDGVPSAERKRRRKEWHENALSFCAGSDLVFLDPDNGIRPEGQSYSSQDNKYVFLEEAADYYNAGQNVVYYCHKGRRTDAQWSEYKRLLRTRIPEADLIGLTFHRGTQRSYIFALQSGSAAGIKQLLSEFLASEWGGRKMFTLEPI